MTVKELIDKLQTLDTDKEICLNYNNQYQDLNTVEQYPEKYLSVGSSFYYIES